MRDPVPSLRARADAVRSRVDLPAVIGRVVKLGRGPNPRGKCPFHGSTSDSLSVVAQPRQGEPFAHCFGCGWHGDVIQFVADHYGLGFVEALTRLERENGLDGVVGKPVRRERVPQARRDDGRETVPSHVMAGAIWRTARPDGDAIGVYLRARGVPAHVLTMERLADVRFARAAPIVSWKIDRKPTSVPSAPAMVSLVRRPIGQQDGKAWEPIGVHVTYLTADLGAKMSRARGDGSLYPARKMLGSAQGGCVVLGPFAKGVPLRVGEGVETVLSGLALTDAPASCGLAALSLDNLQGFWRRTPGGALPLYDVRPDPHRPSALAFAHDGPVVGLIDADMQPLRGPIDGATGLPRGLLLIERRGGPIVRRAISTGERAEMCGTLFVKSWRIAGCRRVSAIRPPMGMDFNDLVRAA